MTFCSFSQRAGIRCSSLRSPRTSATVHPTPVSDRRPGGGRRRPGTTGWRRRRAPDRSAPGQRRANWTKGRCRPFPLAQQGFRARRRGATPLVEPRREVGGGRAGAGHLPVEPDAAPVRPAQDVAGPRISVQQRDRLRSGGLEHRARVLQEPVERRRQRGAQAADGFQQPVEAFGTERPAQHSVQIVRNRPLERVVQRGELGQRGAGVRFRPGPVVVFLGHGHDPVRSPVDHGGRGHRQRCPQQGRLPGDDLGGPTLATKPPPEKTRQAPAPVCSTTDAPRRAATPPSSGDSSRWPAMAIDARRSMQVSRPKPAPRRFRAGPALFPPTRASRSAGEVSLTHLGVVSP